MFLNLIKNFFLKKNKRKKSPQINNTTNEIAFIINKQSVLNLDEFKTALQKILLQDQKAVFIYFDEFKKDIAATDSNLISAESFNWKAQLKNQETKHLLNKSYLFCVAFSKQNLYITKIANEINAPYKFEITDARNDIFDVSLICSMTNNTAHLESLKKYLKSFNLI